MPQPEIDFEKINAEVAHLVSGFHALGVVAMQVAGIFGDFFTSLLQQFDSPSTQDQYALTPAPDTIVVHEKDQP